ncbi:fibronectin type III domain-containing protein [Aquihabitans sp. G128]|nr:fibronectin type III domain-containing protein [Aquihabitans sp. G128]QXC59216.1 fibronectin type III domain-containing protein [Aquihabitans sp. G128]
MSGAMGRKSAGSRVARVSAVVLASVVAVAGLPGGALAAPTAPAAPPPTSIPSAPPAASKGTGPSPTVHGIDAVDDQPAVVAQVAATNHLTTSAARKLLSDPTVWVHPDGHLYFADPPQAHPATATAAEANAVAPYSTTFRLHSRPGSKRTIYLDFDGATVTGTAWAQGATIVASAYDSDDEAGFSVTELDEIQTMWQRVAEDYVALDVDVTTEEPAAGALRRDTAADDSYGTRVVVTELDASVVTDVSATGVANYDAFDAVGAQWDALQPAWAFPDGLGHNPKWVGEVISHEVGHTLGLSHDGGGNDGEYYQGHGVWGPIMGAAYTRPVSQFSKGEYTDPSNTEDDFSVMASHGVTAPADDHTSVLASATPLASTATGTITAGTDKDLFSYVATATGTWTFRAEPTSSATNLDIKLALLSAGGTQLATADPAAVGVDDGHADGLAASISYAVTAGTTYYVRVEPAPYLTPGTGYSTYGTVGSYVVSASNQPTCSSLDVGEPDSSPAEARVATSGQVASARICRGDVDYVGLPVKAGQQVSLSLGFSHAAGNLDLALVGPDGTVVASSTSTDDDEAISHTAATSGIYVAEIAGATRSVANTYAFTMTAPLCPGDDSLENNDSLGTARGLQPATTYAAVACAGDDDFYSMPVAADSAYRITVTSASRYGRLVLEDYDASGAIVDTQGADFPEDELTTYGYASGRSAVRFRVRSGEGKPNLYSVRVTRVPDVPTGIAATPGYRSATVSWTPPVQTGGEPVTSYDVEASVGGEVVGWASSTGSPVTVGFLQPGQVHTIRVHAVNSVGQGLASSAVTVTPSASPSVPGIPGDVAAFDDSGTVVLSWSEPPTDGGSPPHRLRGHPLRRRRGPARAPIPHVGDGAGDHRVGARHDLHVPRGRQERPRHRPPERHDPAGPRGGDRPRPAHRRDGCRVQRRSARVVGGTRFERRLGDHRLRGDDPSGGRGPVHDHLRRHDHASHDRAARQRDHLHLPGGRRERHRHRRAPRHRTP